MDKKDIFYYCKQGDLTNLKRLIEKENIKYDTKDRHDSYLSHIASEYGYLDILKYLTEECKMDPLLMDENNETPLYIALYSGNLDIVKYFIEDCKVDPKYGNRKKNELLFIGIYYEELEILKYVVEELGENVDMVDEKLNTPLHLSTYTSGNVNLSIIKYLIDCGANTKLENERGCTFLDYLTGREKKEIEEYIQDIEYRKLNMKSVKK